MAKVLVSEKYLHDIANAIRVKLDSQSTYTPAQMAAAIADITGSISGTITPSTDADKVLVTDSSLTAIANAIRAKLDVATLYTPAQMADAILSIAAPTPVVEIVSWANGTDTEVAAMLDAAHAGLIDLQTDGGWAVGDTRTIRITSFTGGNKSFTEQNVNIVITSFDDYMNCGCLLQFDFTTPLDLPLRMNLTATNIGGYGATEIKTDVLPALVGAMPDWLSEHLLTFNVLASAGNTSADFVTVSNNKLALRSEIEIFGSCTYSAPGEGNQLVYYSNESNRIKRVGLSTNRSWWLRSPRLQTSSQFCRVTSGGAADNMEANDNGYTYLAPFGCL